MFGVKGLALLDQRRLREGVEVSWLSVGGVDEWEVFCIVETSCRAWFADTQCHLQKQKPTGDRFLPVLPALE